jgi:hypothetical protein
VIDWYESFVECDDAPEIGEAFEPGEREDGFEEVVGALTHGDAVDVTHVDDEFVEAWAANVAQ